LLSKSTWVQVTDAHIVLDLAAGTLQRRHSGDFGGGQYLVVGKAEPSIAAGHSAAYWLILMNEAGGRYVYRDLVAAFSL
jgi:hypothetical protein